MLSRTSENWTGATGYVQDLLASNISNICKIDGVEFYLCGPPQMMNSTIDLLKANNVDISDIAYDEFIALKEHQKEHFSKQQD
jgi:Na+-transporting NADH:ubiquinone oxidoreductase subunit NqrF